MFKALRFFCTICFFIQVSLAQPAKIVVGNTTIFKVNQVLQSNMVVQQNKPFKVWGEAEAGTTASFKADWIAAPVTVVANADSNFLAIIPVPQAKPGDFTAHQISVQNGKQTIVLANLLIGDLWFLSGQSNMQFPMKEVKGAGNEAAKVQDPNIRILNPSFNSFYNLSIKGFCWYQDESNRTERDSYLQLKAKADSAFTTNAIAVHSSVNAPSFAITYRGYTEIPTTGVYTFYLNCDDGGIFKIAGRMVVDNDDNHTAIEKNGQVALGKGLQPFALDFIEGGGGFALKLKYSFNGSAPAEVPASWFKH
ncbi:PA14 domain-containing protein [Mucilaginibacter sp. RB4R14]|uniref:PA14 domain-containing protein n=1 Tax=Mucilaginibacter aurantiaciroseus TaxID=2949308 RepID=UPI002091C681|nr:PA14 domain-containing protein [Mucilaginibacter aurantiaciroseus]MCO5935709.1 PA14 domain-containing protein [Mucilaginibacter aurantiaciroseus]